MSAVPNTHEPLSDVYRACADEALSTITAELGSFEAQERAEFLGHISVTQFHLGDIEAARNTLADPVLQTDSDLRFSAWASLVIAGDKSSIPTVRAAAAESSEQLSFVEVVTGDNYGGIHSAEKLVTLVTIGDSELLPLARKAANGVYLKKRSDLLSILYQSGDDESLDLALQAIEDARSADAQETEALKARAEARGEDAAHVRYTQNATWAEMNIDELLGHALKEGRPNDAHKILEHCKSDARYDRLLKIYASGITDVYDEIVETASRGTLKELNPTTIALAKGGDASSQKIVRRLTGKLEKKLLKGQLQDPETGTQGSYMLYEQNRTTKRNLYGGLATLYTIGDEGISKRAVKCIEADDNFDVHNLAAFDDTDMDTEPLYQVAYDRSDEGFTEVAFFKYGFSAEGFREKLAYAIERSRTNSYWISTAGRLMTRAAWLAENS